MSLRDWWRVLTTPSCWLRVGEYDEAWDREVNDALQRYSFERAPLIPNSPWSGYVSPLSNWEVKLGPLVLWACNHPFASFAPSDIHYRKSLPRRITVLRAWDKLIDEIPNWPDVVGKRTHELERA